jgi:hypothetical protein
MFNDGVQVAVKYMHTELVNAHIAEFYKEASILFELRHPNVVTVYGLMMPKVQSDNPQQQLSPAIVTEYAPLGSLRNKLSTKPKELSKLRRIQVCGSGSGFVYVGSGLCMWVRVRVCECGSGLGYVGLGPGSCMWAWVSKACATNFPPSPRSSPSSAVSSCVGLGPGSGMWV